MANKKIRLRPVQFNQSSVSLEKDVLTALDSVCYGLGLSRDVFMGMLILQDLAKHAGSENPIPLIHKIMTERLKNLPNISITKHHFGFSKETASGFPVNLALTMYRKEKDPITHTFPELIKITKGNKSALLRHLYERILKLNDMTIDLPPVS